MSTLTRRQSCRSPLDWIGPLSLFVFAVVLSAALLHPTDAMSAGRCQQPAAEPVRGGQDV